MDEEGLRQRLQRGQEIASAYARKDRARRAIPDATMRLRLD